MTLLIGEILLISIILVDLFRRKLVLRWLRRLSPGDSNLFFAIIVVVIAAHFLNHSEQTFPLVGWRMYSHNYSPKKIQWPEIRVTRSDGSVEKVNPARLFPSIARNFHSRLRNVSLLEINGMTNSRQQQVLNDLLHGYVRKINSHQFENPVIRIDLFLCTVRPESPMEIDRQSVRTWQHGQMNSENGRSNTQNHHASRQLIVDTNSPSIRSTGKSSEVIQE